MEGGKEPVGIHHTLNMIVGTEVIATLVSDGGKLETEGGWEDQTGRVMGGREERERSGREEGEGEGRVVGTCSGNENRPLC